MKKNYLLILFFLCFCMQSCVPMLKIYMGVRRPKEISDRKIEKYYHRKGLTTENILRPIDTAAWRKIFYSVDGAPDLYVFNTAGQSLQTRVKGQCNAKDFDVSEVLCDTINKLTPDNKMDLNVLWPLLRHLKKQNHLVDRPNKPVILITAARFTGMLNKDHVKMWEQNLAKQKCDFVVYKVVIDQLKP